MYALYTAAVALALVIVFWPSALARRLTQGVPLHLRARLGLGAAASSPSGWVHAVSVGEALAATPLVEGLRRLWPDLPLVVTTVTDTGARVVRERLGELARHRFFPVDLPGPARRVIAAINPVFLICMETELWPNVLRRLGARGVPVMIANGRISDRSFRRYRLARPFMTRVLRDVRVFAMQSEEDARRIIALGAIPERVVVTGNIKHEPPADAGAPEIWRRLLGLDGREQVWVAGSTHRGEEEMVLEAHGRALPRCPGLTLVLAPRHPERTGEVSGLVAARGWPAIRRTALPRTRARNAVIVLDTVGELASLYAVADVVFVGGSLVPHGGHNMLEPAFRGKPVLFGPHTHNFREIAALLASAGGAVVVRDAAALGDELVRLLQDDELRRTMGAVGATAAARHGAVRDTLDLVTRYLLPARPDGPEDL